MDVSRSRFDAERRRRASWRALPCYMCAALGLTPLWVQSVLANDGSPVSPERIAVNDNRSPAGTLRDGTLTVRLEARDGEWHPDGDSDPGVVVRAFGVEGGPLQIPGPLIRVKEGTEVRALVRNGLDGQRLVIHGLNTRTPSLPDASAIITIEPGEVREIRFLAAAPGTFYYWGTTGAATGLAQRSARDSQLSGAFIVESRNATAPADRVFVISGWNDSLPVGGQNAAVIRRIVMNGKSWPNTERLSYQVGDSVRMRLINAGAAVHPMHLHGFYFNVDSRGDERTDRIFAPGSSPHLVVTERLAPGGTFSLTWVPTRAGNWLFHCHDNAHITRDLPLDGRALPAAADHHVVNHALEMMGGPVMGISVLAKTPASARVDSNERRRLRLVAQVDAGGTEAEPAFGFVLEDGKKTIPSAPPYLPGPTIVLKRGEPVSITIVNKLSEPTAVHWHGIELESYYDGVAGFAGDAGRIAPAIAPGESFEARFTPPRAGTFIYHTHIDEVRQQQAGLSGALLVLDSPAAYDPQQDIVLLVTVPRRSADGDGVLLNGSLTPAPREMRAGERYRLRFINVHTYRPSMRMRAIRDSTLLTWRALAKDGMDLPPDQATVGPSVIQMGNGETYDFEFVPTTAGDIRIEVTSGVGDLLVSMPVHVR
jgi:FtsP/CotA-like multicopper oxidase with cupredoxin domain